jgi:hypothetical protein
MNFSKSAYVPKALNMILSKKFLEYSNFDITPVEGKYRLSATFLILKVFKGFNTNSFDKHLVRYLSNSFENIRVTPANPNYIETFVNLPEFKYIWRDIQCESNQPVTEEEFMNKIYEAYESCYENSFISSVSSIAS